VPAPPGDRHASTVAPKRHVLEARKHANILGPYPIARVAIVPTEEQVAARSHSRMAAGECTFGLEARVKPPAEDTIADDQIERAAGVVP